MKKYSTELKWGFIFVVVFLIWMIIEKVTGLHDEHIDKHGMYTMLFAIPAIAVYVFALREKRDKDLGGTMGWKEGFVSGAIITLIVTFLSPLTQWLVHSLISPGFFQAAMEHAVETEALSRPEAEAYFTMGGYIIQSMIGAFVMGILTSAVVAFFVKKP